MKEGSDNFKVLVQHEDFDVSSELALLRQDNNQVGAIASFVGLVRDINDGLGRRRFALRRLESGQLDFAEGG